MGRKLTRDQFVEYLRHVGRPQFVSLIHASVPSMKKKGNPYTIAKKHQHVHGLICFNYENSVNRQMPEGYRDFKAGPRVWGQRLGETPLVEHKGEYYLEVLVIREIEPPFYKMGDEFIDAKDIEPFLKSRRDDHAIVRPRDFKIKGILQVHMSGEELCITDS